jgi:hypothetical protein
MELPKAMWTFTDMIVTQYVFPISPPLGIEPEFSLLLLNIITDQVLTIRSRAAGI